MVVPALCYLEILNVAARRWRWDGSSLLGLSAELERLDFEVADPPLAAIARWAGEGLTAYDACYVALAEIRGVPLVTNDQTVISLAPDIAQPRV